MQVSAIFVKACKITEHGGFSQSQSYMEMDICLAENTSALYVSMCFL